MKRLPFLLFFLLSFVVAKGQQVHQAPTFIFNASGPIPAGNHIFEAVQYVEFQEGSDYNAINGESLEAKINPYLLFPPTGGEIGGPKTGDDGVVGAISGSLDVSQSGAANYSIPIEIPDGVAGMKPNISFRYNSLSGNGPLGIGWSLSGFSSINRTSTDFYHDGPNIGVNGVHFDQNDQFTLDGQRLIDINNSTYGSEGAEYRTEIQSFVKIISHGSAGNGPSWFEAWTKDGKIIEYGSTNDSRIEAPGKTDVFFWMVSKIRDRQGNYISFEYNENGDMTCSPSRITYTGNSTINPTIVPFYAVEFTYEGRPDRSTNFLGGSYINMNLRLSKIDIRYLPTQAIYKEYTLTYTNSVDSTINSISNYYSHLQSVGVNDGTSTHLNPTVFEWGNQPSQFELHNVMSPERYEVITGDYNGDGKTDIVRAYNYESSGHKIYTSWELFLANSNGTDFNHFINAGGGNLGDGCQGFISGDFNGDGMSDLMELYDNWWNEDPHDHLALFLAKTGNTGFEGFYPVQTVQGFSMSTDYRFMGIQVGDFNGDGLEDIAVRCSHKSDYEKYSDEYDCKVLLSNFDAVNNIVSLTEIPNITNINRFYVGNFYDKTRKDLLVLKNSICSIYFWNNQLNNFSKLTPDFGYPTKYHTIFPADFNGDGITDVLTCIRTSDTDVLWELTEFTGKEQWPWPTVPITFLPNANPYDNEGHYNVFPCDYNGDGKSDIMSIDAYTKQVKFFFSKGKGEFINTPEITSIDAFGISSNHFSFTDFNGDGIADILYYKSIFDPLILLLVHPNDNSELVKKITNGFGKIDKITYHPLTTSIYQKYFTTYAATLATVKDFQGPLHVVSITESDNGKGGFLSRTYSYEGALIQRINNEFLGFSKVTTTDHSTGIISKNTYDYLITYEGNPNSNSFYFPHLVKSETFFGQHLISETENIYKAYQYFPNLPLTGLKAKLILPYLTKSNSKSWEIDGNTYIKTSRSTIGYSASSLPYGNPIVTSKLNDSSQIAIAEPDNSFTFKESVSTTYYPYDETNWIISNVDTSTTQTFIKNLGFQTKVRQFVYYPVGDANGRTQLLWKDIIEPGNDPLSVLTEYDYDPNGNIKSKRLSAPNANPPIPSRLTTYEYNPVYQSRFITKITDPLNHFAESDFDPLTGNLASETDINNLSSTHLSDIFGTNSKTEAPDGTKNIIILRWKNGQAEAPGDALFLSWEQTSGNSEIYTYYDKLGRVLRKVTKGFNDRSIFVDQEYDVYGRPTKTSDPYFSGDSPLYTEKKYNTALSRVDYQIFPDQTHVWYTYHGPTTITTNEAGQPKTQKKNAIDLLDESTDANSRTVKYEYAYQGNDFISTVAIDNLSATQTVIKIDKFGNRINIIDPSSGSIEETYNAFGELISRKDQKQTELNKTQYTYDMLGRMITRVEDGQLTTWTYDTKHFGIGKLDSVSNSDNAIGYHYDALGRVKYKFEGITGEEKPYLYKYTYDSYSRLQDLTYPSNIIIRNQYKSNGYLFKIAEIDNGTEILWETNVLNAKDQVAQAAIGNVITTDYGYQATTGNLTSIHSATNSGVLQDLEYQWYNIGNLLGRKKWIDRNTSSYLEEVFQYDVLNRLTSVRMNNVLTQNHIYDDLGNITEKTPLTNMTYGGTGVSPYAITASNFTGNEIPAVQQDITYTAFDKINTISEGTSTLELTYGADHERIKQIIRKNGTVSATKLYIGGLCEKITDDQGTRFINFINGPQGLFAIIVKNIDGLTNINYILKDHLGSIQCITDKSGNLLEELSFDAWGRRRNPSDWSYTNVPSTYIFDRGFTGHEHLDLFGLINMNGRAYDPLVGRFLSVDAFVQTPDFTQSFNRYSYCMNNPLKYTDPTGEFWHIIIGALVGGVVNLATNWNNCDGFWEYAAAFVVGAGAGAATAATGGVAGAGFWATTGVAALGGAATMSTNSVIAQTGHNFSGMGNVDWGQVGKSGIIGSVSGFAGSAAGYWAANSSMLVSLGGNGVNNPILRSAIVSPLAAGAGHIAGGTTAGMLSGQSIDVAFENSFEGLGNSMLMGATLGVTTTVGMSFAKGMNPITGKTMWPKNNGFNGTPERTILKKGTTFDRLGDETGRFAAPDGTPFDSRSLPPNAKLSPLTTYKVVSPIPAYQGTTSGSFWFNSSGGGTQYMFDYSIEYLRTNGFIQRVP